MEKITAVLPCRLGSTRLKFDKQSAPFGDTTLIELKVNQLLKSKLINDIVLSTDDENIFKKFANVNRVKVYERDPKLLHSTDSNSLIEVCFQHVPNGYVLLTHCTVPFFDEYDKVIEYYKANNCDSVSTARRIGSFVMDGVNIMNWNRTGSNDLWPKTQELPKWYEIDSAVEPFMHIDIMKERYDRVGYRPMYYETNALQSIDIDTEEDWKLAETLYKKLNG